MTKTRKLLSIVLAAVMLLSCCSISSFAIDWPKELGAGGPEFFGTSTLKSVQIPVSADFTAIDEDAEFVVYYTTENLQEKPNALQLLTLKKVGTVHAESAYVADGVLHIDLSGLGLSEEGFYHIYIASGSLTGVDCTNILDITSGVEYAFASLNIIGKLQAFIGYFFSLISNLLSNGQTY